MANDSISSTQRPERAADQYNEALCAIERCKALGRAIQHESEDGDELAPLFTVLDRELEAIDKILETNRAWGGYGPPKESGATSDDDDDIEQPPPSPAQTFSEYTESELADIKKIITQIDVLAHDGQESLEPGAILAIIERLAWDASRTLHGEFWDKLTAGLKRADGGAA